MATAVKHSKRARRKVRIRSRIHGTAECPRLVVFRSNKNLYAQLIDDDAGKTLIAVSNMSEKTNNLATATKIGEEVGKKAVGMGITACVFDRNGYKYHGRVKALADGARSAGLQF